MNEISWKKFAVVYSIGFLLSLFLVMSAMIQHNGNWDSWVWVLIIGLGVLLTGIWVVSIIKIARNVTRIKKTNNGIDAMRRWLLVSYTTLQVPYVVTLIFMIIDRGREGWWGARVSIWLMVFLGILWCVSILFSSKMLKSRCPISTAEKDTISKNAM